MDSTPVVVLFAPSRPGGRDARPYRESAPVSTEPRVEVNAAGAHSRPGVAAALQSCGFVVCACPDLPRLSESIAGRGGTTCLILGATPDENCHAAARARVLEPGIGIVALVPATDEDAAMQVLRSGADACCPGDASAPLLGAVVFAVLRRVRRSASRDTAQAPRWSLRKQDWALVSANGCEVPLTAGERAFLAALLNAPGLRASHAELAAAVAAAYGSPGAERGERHLGLLVSRMRKKFGKHGADLPLRSVHGWGYVFAQEAFAP